MVREWENSLERLGELPVNKILEKLEGKWIGILACAGKISKKWTEDDRLWEKLCFNELSLDFPLDPLGNSCPTFKLAYYAWRESFKRYPWHLVLRVKSFWDSMRIWLSGNFDEALATLQTGASDAELDELETTLRGRLPLSMRILYRFCNGQDVGEQDYSERDGSPVGLIGGYKYYDISVNVYLLPITQIIRVTLVCRCLLEGMPTYIAVATSSTHCPNLFFLDCGEGQLYIPKKDSYMHRVMLACVLRVWIRLEDGMLFWLEEHLHRLQSGFIGTQGETPNKSISLYPRQHPHCSEAVTRGIQVRASGVFVPEFFDSRNEPDRYFYTYCVKMSLSPNINDTSQLSRRHLLLYADATLNRETEGDCVTENYPILGPTRGNFEYQSCATLPSSSGYMEGSYTFVPGRLDAATGSI